MQEAHFPKAWHVRALVGPDRARYRFGVTKAATKLLEQALKLDPASRAELAAELITSLDAGADEGVEAAWAAEIEQRAARARSGDDPGEPWSEVRGRIERDLRSR
ncbi:addiction module protein [Candidatus Binatia bacterium]|jgi:putative addiction module component (TIGR02574 family)|nr:addiction module protein [Candidatus Binatia bacterium]